MKPDSPLLPQELENIPHRVRLLKPDEMRRQEAEVIAKGDLPHHPAALGVSVGLVNPVPLILEAFLAFLAIFVMTSLVGEFGFSDIMAGIITLGMAFMCGFLLYAAFALAKSDKSHLLRTVIVVEPDALRISQTTLFGPRRRTIPRSEIQAVELLATQNHLEAALLLASGERVSPFKAFMAWRRPAWLAWLLHAGLRLELRGNLPLGNLATSLVAGKSAAGHFADHADGPETGAPISIAGTSLPPTCEEPEHGFRSFGVGEPDAMLALGDAVETTRVPRPEDFVVLRDYRSWTRTLHDALASLIWFALLVAKFHAETFDSVKSYFMFSGVIALQAGGIALMVHHAVGKCWLLLLGDTLLRRRQWLFLKMDKRFARDDIAAVESIRDRSRPDAHDLFIRTRDGKRTRLFADLHPSVAAWLPASIAAWAETDFLERLTLRAPSKSALFNSGPTHRVEAE